VDLTTFPSSNKTIAAMANGDIYELRVDLGPGIQIEFLTNVFGGPTPATQSTWGQIKAKYRPGAAAQDK
jgi:hypothetical protein